MLWWSGRGKMLHHVGIELHIPPSAQSSNADSVNRVGMYRRDTLPGRFRKELVMNLRPKSPSEVLQEVFNNETAKRPPSKRIEEPDEKGLLLDQLIRVINASQ